MEFHSMDKPVFKTSPTVGTPKTYTTWRPKVPDCDLTDQFELGSLRVIRRVRVAEKYRVLWNTRKVAIRSADTKRERNLFRANSRN